MKRPLRILHVSPSYYPATYWGGPIFSVYSLNNALAQLPDVALKVLTTDAAGPHVRDRIDRRRAALSDLYPNHEVLIARRIAVSSVSAGLLRELPAHIDWADVVHLTAVYSFPTIPTLALCKLQSKPLVWSLRGAILQQELWASSPRVKIKRAWELVCNSLLVRGQTYVHVTSAREADAATGALPNAEPLLIPNGVDVPRLAAPRPQQRDDTLRVMYLGRLHPIKALENLLLATGRLEDSTSLTIYGSGDTAYVQQLKTFATSIGAHHVRFAGHVEGEAKRLAFAAADVCVVPSYSENFSNVVVESLLHGVPVIASKNTPWAELEQVGCGLWVDNSPESLRSALAQIRTLDLQQMGLKGRDWAARRFSADVTARAMLRAYHRLLASGRAAHT